MNKYIFMNTIHSVSNTSLMRSSEAIAVRNSFSFRTFMMRVILVMAIVVGGKVAWGQVVSGRTYETKVPNSMPTGWTTNASTQSNNYLMLTTDSKYIQTCEFCQNGFTRIVLKARKYGGPSDAQALITVSWYDATTSVETVLGTITPTSTTLTNYTISSPSNPTANTNGYIKIQCKGANGSKGSGVSEVTITYTTGTCGSIIPTHTLTYSVNPVGAGTIVLSSTTVAEGSTTTATATPNTGYAFDHWSISGTDASLSSTSENHTTVTMGTSNATVTAHFTEIPKYEITFNNGTGTLSTLTEEYGGAGIVLPSETAPYCNSPSYIFYGWAEEEVSNPSIVPTIVGMAGNRYFPSRNTTLYAVYATVSEYSKVTSSPDYEDKTGIYLIVCENDGVAFDGRKDPLDVSSNNVGVAISNNTIASNNTIDSISFYFFNIENNYTIRSSSGKFIGRDSDSNGLDSDASTEYSNAISFSSGNANIVSGGAYLRYNYTSGQNRFRYYKSTTYTGQRAIQLYKAVATYTSEPLCASATVIYDANGATGGDVPIDSNSPYPLVNGQRNIELLYNTGNLVKTGYTFDGWNIEADGSGSSYSEGDTFTLTENTILYAKWNPNNYTISWRVNGLSDGDYTYPYNTLIPDGDVPSDESTLEYVCDDKTFVGWSETASELFDGVPTLLQRNQIVNTAVTGNKTYYAVFAKRTGGSEYWNLVTDDSDLHSGDVVVITSNVEGKVAGDISSQIMSAVTSSFSGTGSGSTITSLGDGAIQLTLEENLGEWTISNGNGEKLGATAAKS
ncbi:MAG: InlB B-repeat-containing protein [Bacteroidales bacterium]|nr:InlB B-repeat-containing protein [Bacteroidales bacterium]